MPTDHTNSIVKRIPTLDGWRGIAILLILIDHARFALHLDPAGTTSTGQHGVAIFFVLSGFLITGRLMRENETTGSVDPRAFYSRRFFRLMPCAFGYLWFCLVISLMSSARTLGIITTLSAVFFCRNFAATYLPEFPLNVCR
jgi:peptidoglycan/LPS O-acetylase OafA/YrhL